MNGMNWKLCQITHAQGSQTKNGMLGEFLTHCFHFGSRTSEYNLERNVDGENFETVPYPPLKPYSAATFSSHQYRLFASKHACLLEIHFVCMPIKQRLANPRLTLRWLSHIAAVCLQPALCVSDAACILQSSCHVKGGWNIGTACSLGTGSPWQKCKLPSTCSFVAREIWGK